MPDTAADWYGPDAATFGDRVAGAREAAGLSQAELARKLGVRKDTVASWEEDRSEPRANKLTMMAGVLNVTIIWLLTGEGEGMAPPPLDVLSAQEVAGIRGELAAIRADMEAAAIRASALETRLAKLVSAPAE